MPHPNETPAVSEMGHGARAVAPLLVPIVAIGLVWGVLAGQAGMSLLETLLTSGLVFAGASQFVALDLWSPEASALPIGTLVVAVGVVNLRFVLLTATLRPLFGTPLPRFAPALMFFVADENWALTVAEMRRRPLTAWFFAGTGIAMYLSWLLASGTGRMLGAAIADPAEYGLDFAFTATFLALLLGMWRGRADLVPWIVAALVALVSVRLVGGHWHILIGALAGSFAGALAETVRRR